MNKSISFICQACKKELQENTSELVCIHCGQSVLLKNGIPIFSNRKHDLEKFFSDRLQLFGDSPLIYVNTNSWFRHKISLYNFYLRYRSFKNKIHLQDQILLDVGCGTGNATDFLVKNNFIYGMDISLEMLKYAQLKGISPLLLSTHEPLPFKDNFFDGILCLGVIPYFNSTELAAIFAEYLRVIKKGGRLFLSSPSPSLLRKNKKQSKIKHLYPLKFILEQLKSRVSVKKITRLYFPIPYVSTQNYSRDSRFSTNWLAELEII